MLSLLLLIVIIATTISILLLSYSNKATAVAQDLIKLQAPSDNGTFLVEINWTTNKIGQLNRFDIHFIDPETRTEIEDVKYDISVYNENGKLELQRANQMTTQQELSFGSPGSYIIKINDIDGLGENATIPLQATPEFSFDGEELTMIITLAATIIGAAILVARQNCNSLFS